MPTVGAHYFRSARWEKTEQGSRCPATAAPARLCPLDAEEQQQRQNGATPVEAPREGGAPEPTHRHLCLSPPPPPPPLPLPSPCHAEGEHRDGHGPQPPAEPEQRANTPALRFFNRALLVGYEAEVVCPISGSHSTVVLALWRDQLDDAGMERLVAATLRKRWAFAPPAEAVTWRHVVDLVESSGCAGVEAVVGAMEWDVRVFRCDPCVTDVARWTYATPPLDTPQERSALLDTDVEHLFQYYHSPLLYVSLERASLPPYPQQQQQQAMGGQTQEPLLRQMKRGDTPAARRAAPRCRRRDGAQGGEWATVAFRSQLVEWQVLQQGLRARMGPRELSQRWQLLRMELRGWVQRPLEEWNGSWMLSLREYECDVLLDMAGYAVLRRGAAAEHRPLEDPRATAWGYLAQCRHGALQTLSVVGKLLRAAKDKELLLSPESFPFALQRVLLLTVELRARRHLSVVEAVLGDTARQERAILQAGRTAGQLKDALTKLGSLGPEWGPLASSLLLGGLSMMEVARCLAVHSGVRCWLAEVAVHLFCVWRGITLDARWAPRSVDDLLNAMAADSVAVDSSQLQRIAALRARAKGLGCGSADGSRHTAPLSSPRASVVATCPGLGGGSGDSLPCIGYCVRQLWSMAALDQLYQHGVRQLGRLRRIGPAPPERSGVCPPA